MKALQAYLLKVVNKDSNKTIRDRRAQYIDGLMDTLLNYAAQVQSGMKPGWSSQSNLSDAQKLWLDPYREGFQDQRAKNDWQQKIADEFARWLNRKVKHKKLSMGNPEYLEWRSLLEEKLYFLKEELEIVT